MIIPRGSISSDVYAAWFSEDRVRLDQDFPRTPSPLAYNPWAVDEERLSSVYTEDSRDVLGRWSPLNDVSYPEPDSYDDLPMAYDYPVPVTTHGNTGIAVQTRTQKRRKPRRRRPLRISRENASGRRQRRRLAGRRQQPRLAGRTTSSDPDVASVSASRLLHHTEPLTSGNRTGRQQDTQHNTVACADGLDVIDLPECDLDEFDQDILDESHQPY